MPLIEIEQKRCCTNRHDAHIRQSFALLWTVRNDLCNHDCFMAWRMSIYEGRGTGRTEKEYTPFKCDEDNLPKDSAAVWIAHTEKEFNRCSFCRDSAMKAS